MIRRLLLLAFIALPLVAQAPTDELWQPNATDPRSAAGIKERFSDRSTADAYIDIFTGIREGLAANPAWSSAEAARVRAKLEEQLTTTLDQLTAARAATGAATSSGEAATQFLLQGHTTSRFEFDDVTTAWFDLHGEPAENVVTLADLGTIPITAAEDFRYRVDAAHVLLRDFGSTAVAQTAKDIAVINARWELFLNKGPSQYPWEGFLNGLLIDTRFQQPPARQFIIFHPLPVVEVTNRSLSDLQADQAFAVELLGVAYYRFGMSKETPTLRWFGASATAGIHEDRDPSWGLMAHYNRTITAGLLWGGDDDRDDPTLILGVDLYQLVQKKVPEYRDRLRKLKALRP